MVTLEGRRWDVLRSMIPRPLRVQLHNARDRRALSRVSRTPVTFTEKLRYKMAFDRRPQLRVYADKVAVRAFVADHIGNEYLTECYGVYRRGGDIDWNALPREFALKASHGSGAVALVWEGAARGVALPPPGQAPTWGRFAIHPDDLTHADLARVADGWMRLRYQYGVSRLPEWAYRGIPPRLLAEELLLDESRQPPMDYKFFMMNGQCALVQVDYTRFGDHRRDLFSPTWEALPVFHVYPAPEEHAPRPDNLGKMVAAAEELSRETDFVRVDLYDVEGRIVFGELTNYPEAAVPYFSPPEFDRELGAMWRGPARY